MNSAGLRLPHTLDGLSQTDIVGLELVETNGGGQRRGAERPPGGGPRLGDTLERKVVDDHRPIERVSVRILFTKCEVETYWNPTCE